MKNHKDNFATRDFGIATSLVAYGFSIDFLEKDKIGRALFVFKESPDDCNKLVICHFADELMVSTKRMLQAKSELKSRLSQEGL